MGGTPTDGVPRFGWSHRILTTRIGRHLLGFGQYLPLRASEGDQGKRHGSRHGQPVYLNDTLVTPSTNTYPFRAYMETALSYGTEAKESQLTSQLCYKDTAGRMESVEIADEAVMNAGLISRRKYTTQSRVVEMMGRLHVDLFLQGRFLLNGVDVKIRLMRSKDAFALTAEGDNPTYKAHIVDASILARKATLSPAVQMAHIKALEKGTAKYPMRHIDCKVYSIPQGAMSHTHENLFLGTLPKRLVPCFQRVVC